jgi:hypothetical protein
MALDGCHLKGIYNKSGLFLTASLKDGANSNLLVALAIVPKEDKENWSWFLRQLIACPLEIPEKFLFVSDRQKGT